MCWRKFISSSSFYHVHAHWTLGSRIASSNDSSAMSKSNNGFYISELLLARPNRELNRQLEFVWMFKCDRLNCWNKNGRDARATIWSGPGRIVIWIRHPWPEECLNTLRVYKRDSHDIGERHLPRTESACPVCVRDNRWRLQHWWWVTLALRCKISSVRWVRSNCTFPHRKAKERTLRCLYWYELHQHIENDG